MIGSLREPRARRALALVLPAAAAAALLTPVAAQSTASVRPGAASLAAGIDSLADSLAAGPVVGMSIVVARGPEVLLAKGYGLSDREANTPATAGTVYQIGSVTKQFTAAAIMRLVEEGRVSLDDEITKYLPDFPTQGKTVTIRHLLNHTSGIRSYTGFLRLTDSMAVSVIYDSIKAQPFDFEPGTELRYNNSGYVLLGLVLERVTAKPYADLVQEWFFTPLGMNDTGYCGAGGTHPPEGYRPGLMDAKTRVRPVDMRVPFAAGALCSTAPDLARWTWALATGKVVQPASYAAMTAGTALSDGKRLTYGYALAADTVHGRVMIHHGGGIPGFVSEAGIFPADSTIVVVLVNTETNVGTIAQRVQEIALGVEPEPVKDLAIDPAEAARLIGTYSLERAGIDIRVFEEDGKLMSQGTDQPAFRLLWQGGGEYRAAFDTSVRLIFGAGNPAPEFTLHQGGGTMRAVRRGE
jgi:CubicO group peptidase (beta-lactamase class C family)